MKYLILGDGQLGGEIQKQTNWNYISRKKDKIDFTKSNTYINSIKYYDVIINCIAYTNTIHNEKEPHWSVNYTGVIDLVNICNKYNKKLVQISTDYIYANSHPEADENDIPIHLNNWYTYTKLLSDGYVQAKSENYLLIRTSFRLKPFPFKAGWLDHLTNADYIDIIGDLIIKLIYKNEQGVFNIGTEIKTLYGLAKQTTPDCIPIMDDHKFIRPHDITMNISKLKNTLS